MDIHSKEEHMLTEESFQQFLSNHPDHMVLHRLHHYIGILLPKDNVYYHAEVTITGTQPSREFLLKFQQINGATVKKLVSLWKNNERCIQMYKDITSFSKNSPLFFEYISPFPKKFFSKEEVIELLGENFLNLFVQLDMLFDDYQLYFKRNRKVYAIHLRPRSTKFYDITCIKFNFWKRRRLKKEIKTLQQDNQFLHKLFLHKTFRIQAMFWLRE